MFATIAVLFLATSNPVGPVRRPCEDWGCGTNGPSLTGIVSPQRPCEEWGCGSNGASLTGITPRPRPCEDWGCGMNGPSTTGIISSSSVRVTAIEFRGGERIDLR